MKAPHASRRWAARAFRFVRILVRMIVVLALLGMVLFIYLRLYGVPGPILRDIMHRANAAGISVSVEGITLTLEGWRADRVCYYSVHPDDLEPIFQAETVYFEIQRDSEKPGVNVNVKAVGVDMAPSVEWGVSIPEGSPSRHVDEVVAELVFLPDRLVLSNGRMEWLGSRFSVDGVVLKRTGPPAEPRKQRQRTVLPVLVTAEKFGRFEEHLKMLSMPGGADIDIRFVVDANDYAASTLDFSAHAEDLAIRGVEFSSAEFEGSYTYPLLELARAGLFQDRKSAQVSGDYRLDTQMARGSLYNTITSNRLMLLLPARINELLVQQGLRIDYLPRLEIAVGPAKPADLINHVSGGFSLRSAGYQGVEIEALRGELKLANNRIELYNLQASVKGQEELAETAGSSMHGGPVQGEVFWDQNARTFGVKADVGFDPHILIRPLAPVSSAATNVISYFNFKNAPPQGHVELGAMVDDWDTFYINIQAVGSDTSFRGVECSSINATTTYRQGRLRLDPVAVVQDGSFAKSEVEIDFRKGRIFFDGECSLPPSAIEDVAYPKLDLFGDEISTYGDVRIVGRGTIDWDTMRYTDFTTTVHAQRLEVPVGIAENFDATVTGKGPVIAVQDASFLLFGGESSGNFQIELNPLKKEMPYAFDAEFSKVDFERFVEFFVEDERDVKGNLSGKMQIEANMATNFFAVANGSGFVRVSDGQLADLPLFRGFSRVMRKVIPGFKTFSITSLDGDFTFENGVCSSDKVRFTGDVISATGRGSYHPDTGFDAVVQTHMLRDSGIAKVVRVITDPLMKIFEMRLSGSLGNPSWKLEKLP